MGRKARLKRERRERREQHREAIYQLVGASYPTHCAVCSDAFSEEGTIIWFHPNDDPKQTPLPGHNECVIIDGGHRAIRVGYWKPPGSTTSAREAAEIIRDRTRAMDDFIETNGLSIRDDIH